MAQAENARISRAVAASAHQDLEQQYESDKSGQNNAIIQGIKISEALKTACIDFERVCHFNKTSG